MGKTVTGAKKVTFISYKGVLSLIFLSLSIKNSTDMTIDSTFAIQPNLSHIRCFNGIGKHTHSKSPGGCILPAQHTADSHWFWHSRQIYAEGRVIYAKWMECGRSLLISHLLNWSQCRCHIISLSLCLCNQNITVLNT